MTKFPESHRDFLDKPIASLTTLAADGSPQSTLIWFLHEDGKIKFSLTDQRVKAKNLLKRPQISLLILDLDEEMRYVDVRGIAVVKPDPDYAFSDRVSAKYSGPDFRELDGPDEHRLEITIEPTSIYAVDPPE